VVIPDAKKVEDDVIVFLDARFAEGSEEAAAQRAAVAGLHRVDGGRALHLVLPHEFREQWAWQAEEVGAVGRQTDAGRGGRGCGQPGRQTDRQQGQAAVCGCTNESTASPQLEFCGEVDEVSMEVAR
jgi:hypothetical protein